MTFPTTFTDVTKTLAADSLDEKGNEARAILAAAGFEVKVGVQRTDFAAIAEIASQEGIREFCPNDISKRFGDEPMMEKWLGKNGGRGMFLLYETQSGDLAGYGWAGAGEYEELPECMTTFAIRLNERMAGKGLGKPFTDVIVSGSVMLFSALHIGLETWGSNTAAVRTYLKAGAVLVTTKDAVRPTLKPAANETDGQRRDIRVFMQFPRTFSHFA